MFVGKAKDALDLVDPGLAILDVSSIFGHFIKYAVERQDQESMEVCYDESLCTHLCWLARSLARSLTHTHKTFMFTCMTLYMYM